MAKGGKKISHAQDVVTREYTVHLRKLLHIEGMQRGLELLCREDAVAF